MSLAREIVLPVRVDDGKSGRQRLVGLMMIDDDHFGAGGVGGGDGGLRGRPAIDGEDETRPSFGKPGKGLGRGSITFGQPVGNIGHGALPVGAQEALDQRDRSRTIDIVIAEYGDLLPRADGGGKARGRLLHVLQARRIGEQRAERWIEIAGRGVGLGAARGKHAAEQLGQGIGLGNGGGGQRAGMIEALDPAIAARRAFHAKDRACSLRYREFQGRRHATPSTRGLLRAGRV